MITLPTRSRDSTQLLLILFEVFGSVVSTYVFMSRNFSKNGSVLISHLVRNQRRNQNQKLSMT